MTDRFYEMASRVAMDVRQAQITRQNIEPVIADALRASHARGVEEGAAKRRSSPSPMQLARRRLLKEIPGPWRWTQAKKRRGVFFGSNHGEMVEVIRPAGIPDDAPLSDWTVKCMSGEVVVLWSYPDWCAAQVAKWERRKEYA